MMHVVGRVLCHAAHCGVFGIVGAAIRYALALAFAQGYGLDVTAKDSALFVDLPANMLGCFVVALIAHDTRVVHVLWAVVVAAICVATLLTVMAR